MEVQVPGLAHRLKLFHTADSRTFLIFFIKRSDREDEYARKPILGRSPHAFETAIKQCLQEGGFSHQVQGTVIGQLARRLQTMEEQYAPPNLEEATSTTGSKQSPTEPQPDLASFVSETKQILDQFQRTFVQNKDDFVNQQKMLNMNSSIQVLTESLKTMEQNLTKQMQELEKSIIQQMDEKISKLLEKSTEI